MLCLLVISVIETDGTYISFWAEKPPNMLRLRVGSALGFNFLVALADVEIIGCLRVKFGGGKRFLPWYFETGWCCPLESKISDGAGRKVVVCAGFLLFGGCRLKKSWCSLLPELSFAVCVRRGGSAGQGSGPSSMVL